MRQKLKIVFISHESNLTGAPILLYNLVKLIAATKKYNILVTLYRGGAIAGRLESLAPVRILKSADYGTSKSFLQRVIKYLRFRFNLRNSINEMRDADVIFNNTVANGKLIKKLHALQIPIISYIHELESVIQYFNRDGSADLTFNYSDCLLFPSEAVKRNLITNHSIVQERLSYLPYYFNAPDLIQKNIASEFKRKLFTTNSIPSNKFYIAGMGTATYRKGIDIFLETCKNTVLMTKDICFVWIGDFEDESMKTSILEEISKNKLENFFFITGKLKHSEYNLSPFDLFFLSSREDPYPLVVLEAALIKIPSLYFSDSGGIGEFVNSDAGWALENFDSTKAAQKLVELKNNPDQIKIKGENAFNKVKQRHTDATFIINEFNKIIDNIKKK